jgi:DNA-binding CsgD family transcriptional regulator
MTELDVRSDRVPRSVGAAARGALGARGEPRKLKRIFEHSHLPMVIVDGTRRYIDANLPARLWFRLSTEEMRAFRIGDLTPAPRNRAKEHWARLLEVGCVAGRYEVYGGDGNLLEVVYFGMRDILPGRHLIAFAPADWAEQELSPRDDRSDASPAMTPREIEVLTLAADGLTGRELAEKLFLSPSTVHTHFDNIYAKLGVRNRAAAVAEGMRLGVIK